MWYHYLLGLAGLYLVGAGIYSIVTNRSMQNIIMNSVQIAIGAAVGYYGYSGITATPTPTFVPPPVANAASTFVGGLRRAFRR